MSKLPPSLTPTIPAAGRGLKAAEWMAENAYIAPGMHRFLTAGGLMVGLWGGRAFMDIVTAHNSKTGDDIPNKQTPEILRPFHGLMRYNAYSDEAADRWKFVADRVIPVAIGAVGAYYGGKMFFHGKVPGREAFSKMSETVIKQFGSGLRSSDVTEAMVRLKHSDATRKWAAGVFVEGSSTGQHLFGALWPFNNGTIAVSFQQGAGRNILLPFSKLTGKLNRFLGNHGGSSRFLYSAQRDTAKWMEANIMSFPNAETWLHEDALLGRVRDALQKYPNRTAEHEKIISTAFRNLIKEGYDEVASFMHAHPKTTNAAASEHLYQFLSGKTHPKNTGLLGAEFDKFLHTHGVDLSSAKLARGPFAFFSRLFGSREHEFGLMKEHATYLNNNFGYKLDPTAWANEQLKMEPWKVVTAYGAGAGAVGAALVGAGAVVSRIDRHGKHRHNSHIFKAPKAEEADMYAEDTSKQHVHNNALDWINGKPLDVAHWVSRVLITPPSMHRFMNAAYLSAVLYGGMKFSNVLTGRNLTKITSGKFITNATGELVSESLIPVQDVWAPFRPLHNLLAYTPGSVAIQDRWRQAAHYIMPVGVGMFGTYTGSHMYFRDREKTLEKPVRLEDYTDRISMEQSKVYAGLTALTSVFNTGSGIHLLPVFNYSSNLHNRFLMGSGQQVALPGLGSWWSGNAGTTPWGVKLTLRQITNYLTRNDTARPKDMPALVHSLIGKLYPDLKDEELLAKKQVMLDSIYDVRDSYLVEGKVPPSKQPALKEVMKKLLSGEGFEMLLQESGLDPAKAELAANGASGKIANLFGKKHAVEQLQESYRKQYARREEAKKMNPEEYLRSLVNKNAEQAPGANDNYVPAKNDASWVQSTGKTATEAEKNQGGWAKAVAGSYIRQGTPVRS
ncbi:MAG: hypothetical protein ACOYNL_05665 [Rickettsiales bacterium]